MADATPFERTELSQSGGRSLTAVRHRAVAAVRMSASHQRSLKLGVLLKLDLADSLEGVSNFSPSPLPPKPLVTCFQPNHANTHIVEERSPFLLGRVHPALKDP